MEEKWTRVVIHDPHGNTVADRPLSPEGAAEQVSQHNADQSAHPQIQEAITGLRTQVERRLVGAKVKFSDGHTEDVELGFNDQGEVILLLPKETFGKIDGVKVNGEELPVDENGKVDIPIPTTVHDLDPEDEYATKEEAQAMVDEAKVTGASVDYQENGGSPSASVDFSEGRLGFTLKNMKMRFSDLLPEEVAAITGPQGIPGDNCIPLEGESPLAQVLSRATDKAITPRVVFDELEYDYEKIAITAANATKTNFYDNGGTWAAATSTLYGYVLPVTPGGWYKWTPGSVSSCVVLLESDNIIVGTNATIQWWGNNPNNPNYHPQIFQIPNNVNFIYFRITNGSTDYKPSFWGKLQSVKEKVAELADKSEQLIDGVTTLIDHRNDVALANGYISQANNGKWQTSDEYKGKVLPFEKYAGEKVSIRKYNNKTCRYAFLAALPSYTNGSTLQYCNGEPHMFIEAEYDGLVPTDCKYLYVYAYSSGSDWTPQILTIGAVLDSYLEDAFVEDEKINIADLEEQDCSLGAANFYMDTSNPVQRHIAIPVTPGEILGILNVGNGDGSQYIFATESYSPPYTNGASFPACNSMPNRVTKRQGIQSVEKVPNDAAYLLLTTVNGTGAKLVYEIKRGHITKSMASSPCKIRIVQWNIGHFAMGAASDTNMTAESYSQKLPLYKSLVNEANADIICISEYNREIYKPGGGEPDALAREQIFSPYPYPCEANRASQSPYVWQAIFSRFKPKSLAVRVFDNSITVQKGRYIQIATINVGGKNIKVASTHLDWGSGDNGGNQRAAQMETLIEIFKDEKYVIICADWNVGSTNEYNIFKDAGYDMANHGFLGDITTLYQGGDITKPRCLDNIVTKGFCIGSIKVYDENLDLSDHMPICCTLTMIE